MAYIGVPQPSRAITSADIAQGAVTLNDISFTDVPANMDISGTIDKHTMRLAEGVTVTGDITISDNLILSKISDDGVGITLTNDSSTRTITGSGSIEASTLAQTPNASLTGMTGTVGSGVTFPAGMTIQTVVNSPNVTPFTRASNVWGEPDDDLRTSITPRFSNSILLLELNIFYGDAYGGISDSIGLLKFYDITNSADVNLDATGAGDRIQCHAHIRQKDHDANDGDSIVIRTSVISANTNARTYTLYERSNQDAGNRPKSYHGSTSDATKLGKIRPCFTITEIKG